jgi:CotH kinase protein/Chitobiase/beta-hexosaminidase C-terminal domain/Secretion system C-terminal sorting domain/Divergent InlB B-repeat domain
MSGLRLSLISLFCCLTLIASAQLRINEVSNTNRTAVPDEDYSFGSWMELYNTASYGIDLRDYYVSDNGSSPVKFRLPAKVMLPHSYQMIYLSGKNRNGYYSTPDHHWETVCRQNSIWKYTIPTGPDTLWQYPSHTEAGWLTGREGIGYGDGDDSTIIPTCTSVYMRFHFNIPDTSKIRSAILHMDYDDGFVAYLNGTEIARSGLSNPSVNWNDLASDHEAVMYTGANPQAFSLDPLLIDAAKATGDNVLAIEVHNVDPLSSDLTAIPFLSFSVDNSTTYFPAPPAWFSTADENIHTSFSLSNSEPDIYLFDSVANLVDHINILPMNFDESIGDFPDGSTTRRYFATPTPNFTNNFSTGYLGHEPTPTLSLSSGFYRGTQSLSIGNTSTDGGMIYFSTDGSYPTVFSTAYTGPLSITASQCLRARCIGSGSLLPSVTATGNYILNDSSTIPMIFITADPADLYGWNGLLDNPWLQDRRPCHISLYEPTGALIGDQNASIKLDGGYGGSRWLSQRSFRVDFSNGAFGEGALHYQLQPDKPNTTKYNSIYIRNGSNMGNSMFMKEGFMQRMFHRDSFACYNAYRPANVYINGAYFGMYELRDKYTQDFYANLTHSNKNNVDILSVSYFYGPGIIRAASGSDSGWYNAYNELMAIDPHDSTYYARADGRVDMKNMADYYAAETWVANVDWLWNNVKLYHQSDTDNKWRLALQDMELGMGYWGNYWDDMMGYVEGNGGYTYSGLFLHSLQNDQFKNFYINRACDLMNQDLLPDSTVPMLNNMYAEALPEWPRQIQRWIDPDPIHVPIHLHDFDSVRAHTDSFLVNRSPFQRYYLQSHYALTKEVSVQLKVVPFNGGRINISTLTPNTYPWTGIYFDGNAVPFTALANSGYRFSHWGTSPYIDSVNLPYFKHNIDTSATIIAYFELIPVDTTVDTTHTAIALPPAPSDWKVFPNPADKELKITASAPIYGSISLTDLQGRLIEKKKMNGTEFIFNTSAIPQGYYFLTSGEGEKRKTMRIEIVH